MDGPTERDPFESLLNAHEDFLDKLAELEATLDEMVATRESSEGNRILLDEAVRFFEEELLPHLRDEDEALLPKLERTIGRHGTLVGVISYEHEEIRRSVRKFREAWADVRTSPRSWPAIEELNRHGIFLVQFLWDHFRKERVSLLPTAREALSPADLDAIRERFAH